LYSKNLNIYIVDMIHSKMMETTKKRGSTSFEKKKELVRNCQTVETEQMFF